MFGIFLSGCTQSPVAPETSQVVEQKTVTEQVGIAMGMDVALYSEGELKLYSPINQESVLLTNIPATQLPSRRDFSAFRVSPQRQYVIWYTSEYGFLGLRVDKPDEVIRIYQPSDWFDTNPFWRFDPQEDVLYLMENEGQTLKAIDLADLGETDISIPFPYGNVFSFSSSGERILFASGFGQDTAEATYLVTSKEGELIEQFETTTPLAKRFVMAFLDDTHVLLTGLQNQLLSVDISQPPALVSTYPSPLEDQTIAIDQYADGVLLVSETTGAVIKGPELTTSQRIPKGAFEGLSRYTIYPYDQQHVLVVEHFRTDEMASDRLWLMDFLGVKKLVVPEFNRREIQTELPVIN